MWNNNASLSRKLENTKKEIRSLLIAAGSCDVTLPKLSNMYKEMLDSNIPFKEFYFTNLRDFLYSMPDVVSLSYNNNNELCAYHIESEKSKHISDLVAKEKKKPYFNKSEFKPTFKNCVDPHLLIKILLKFKTSCKNNRNVVSKADVLSAIINHIGVYSFYTITNLNNQLYELNHILIHDEQYIYFKENFFLSEKDDNKHKAQVSIRQESNSCNNNDRILKNINKNSAKKSFMNFLIKDTIKVRLQKLIEKHEDGIWCSELPKTYLREYGIELEYTNVGFNSIVEFVDALPDILKIVKLPNSKQELIINANTSINDIKYLKKFKTMFDVIESEKLTESEDIDSQPIPTILSAEVSKTLIPQWVMNIDETVEQIDVTSLLSDTEKHLDIIIVEVYNPSFFWILLRKNEKIINQLMNQLQEFYTQQDLDKYKIPEIILQKGLNIACIYAEMWHRGLIQKITPDGLVVFFYDYGTLKMYNKNDVYFLDRKFSIIPAQAILCSLHNIKPIEEKKWPKETTKMFSKMVFEKHFNASISNVNEQNNSIAINLIDINDKDNEVQINEWMVIKKLAEWGVLTNNKKNFTFNHYKKCKEIMKNKLSIIEYKNKLSINESKINDETFEMKNYFTKNYVSFDKKLKALKEYRENLYNSSQKSLVVNYDSNVSNLVKKSDEQIFHCQKNDSTEQDQSFLTLIYKNNNNSENSVTSSSCSTDNFVYNINSNDRNNTEISRSYNSKNKNSNKTLSNNFNNIINELNTLKVSIKS